MIYFTIFMVVLFIVLRKTQQDNDDFVIGWCCGQPYKKEPNK